MAQQIIDFGAFPNDPAADPIRAAFAKVQNNFTDLYSTTLTTGVVSLTTGSGLAQNRTTGSVVITANIPSVTIQTGSGLAVGIGAATGNSATITNGQTPFVIGLSGNITVANLTSTNIYGTLRTPSQPYITSVGTLVSLGVTGNVTAANFVGNLVGGTISGTFSAPGANTQVLFNNRGNLAAASRLVYTGTTLNLTGDFNVTNGNININQSVNVTQDVYARNYYGTFIGPASNASVVSGNAQPNITSVGTLTSLQVAGTLISPAIQGNVTGSLLGNVTGNLTGTADRALQVTSNNQPNITSLGNLVTLNVDGNAAIGNISATFITGTVQSANQPNIRKVGLLDGLAVEGNMTGGNISLTGNVDAARMNAGFFSATTMTVGTMSGNVLGTLTGNVSGNVSGNISGDFSGNVAGNVSGNISGNLSGTMTGNVSGNVSGNISGNIGVPGTTTQLLFNDGGIANAHTGATYNRTTGLMSITANLSAGNLVSTGIMFATSSANVASLISRGDADVTGNVTGANLVTNGILRVQGNANVGNITTTRLDGTVVSVSGNVSGANLIASGIIRVVGSAALEGGANINGTIVNAGNVTTANVNVTTKLTTLDLSARGNLDGANITTGGILAVVGNASAGNLSTGIIVATGNINGGANTSITIGGSFVSSGLANVGSFKTTGNASIDGIANVGTLTSQGNVTVSQQIFATGNINATAAWVNAQNANITGNAQFGNLGTPGNINATSGWVNAANANITAITAGNVTGGNVSASAMYGNALSVNGTANFSHVVLPNITTVAVSSVTYIGTTVTVTTSNDHGMAVAGAQITISGLTATTNPPNGTWIVATIVSTTSFTFTATSTPTGSVGSGAATLSIKPLMTSTGSGVFGGTLSVTGTGTFGNASTTHLTASGDLYANSGLLRAANTNITGTATLLHVNSSGNARFTGSLFNVSAEAQFGEVTQAGNITSQANVQAANLVATNTLTGGNLSTPGQLTVAGTANVSHMTLPTVVLTGTSKITSILYVGTTIRVTTVDPHGMTVVGATIVVTNASTTTNGTWTVSNIVDANRFEFIVNVAPSAPITVGASTSITIRPILSSAGSASIAGNVSAGNVNTSSVVALGNVSATSGYLVSQNANVTGIANVAMLETAGSLYANTGLIKALSSNITGTLTSLHIDSTGNANFSGSVFRVTANANIGNIADVMHITSTGDITTLNGLLKSANANITGIANIATANISGNSTHGNIETLGILNVRGNAIVGNASMTHVVASGNANVGGALLVSGQANVGNLRFPTATTLSGTISVSYVGTAITVTSTIAHGLTVGTEVVISGVTTTGTNAPNGVFLVTTVPATPNSGGNPTTFTVTAAVAPTGTLGGTITITVRPLITSAGSGIFDGRLRVGGNAEILGSLTGLINLSVSSLISGTTFQASDFNGANANITGNARFGNLTTPGSITSTGEASIGGVLTVTGTAQSSFAGNLSAPHMFLSGNVEAGILKSSGIMTAVGNISGGNLVTNGLLTVTGNASIGNITTRDINGTLVSVSGNVSGANLVASGILAVTGTANVGNLSLPSTLIGITSITNVGNLITVTTSTNHNATTGTEITLTGTTATTNPPNVGGGNPNWFVITVTGARTFTFTATLTPTGAIVTTLASLNIRPFLISTGSATFGGGLTATGNIIASAFTGVGSGLSNLVGGNVTGYVALASAANTASTAGSATTVTGSSQTAITQVGNLISLVVGAGASNATFTTNGALSLAGNLNAGNILANGFFITAANGANIIGNVSSSSLTYGIAPGSYTNITGVGTLNSLTVTNGISTGLATLGGLVVTDAADSHVNFSSNQGLTAASNNPVMNKTINIITAVGATPYNVLTPTVSIGRQLYVFNDSAQTINILPQGTGVTVEGIASYPLGPGARIHLVAGSLTKWYALTAVYA